MEKNQKFALGFGSIAVLSLAATITCYYTNTGMVEALGQEWAIVVMVVPAVLFAILSLAAYKCIATRFAHENVGMREEYKNIETLTLQEFIYNEDGQLTSMKILRGDSEINLTCKEGMLFSTNTDSAEVPYNFNEHVFNISYNLGKEVVTSVGVVMDEVVRFIMNDRNVSDKSEKGLVRTKQQLGDSEYYVSVLPTFSSIEQPEADVANENHGLEQPKKEYIHTVTITFHEKVKQQRPEISIV